MILNLLLKIYSVYPILYGLYESQNGLSNVIIIVFLLFLYF